MKVSLRFTLLTIFSLVVGTTVSVVGVISYRHARFTANNLARQLLEQTMGRIASQIDDLLRQATKLNAVTEQRLKSGQIEADDFVGFVRYALNAMLLGDDMSGFFIGLESTGESVGVSNLSDKPSIWRSSKNRLRGTYEVREYWPADFPENPFVFDPTKSSPDIRTRPWYVRARAARRSVWTDVSMFLGVDGVNDVFGLSYATPIYGGEGELLAVLDADFELQQLCRFLGTLKLGRRGFAFVIGRQADGTRRVIAHPELQLLLRRTTAGEATVSELRSPEEFPDPRVWAFTAQMRPEGSVGRDVAQSPVRFLVNGEAYLGAVQTLDADSHPPWVICAGIPEHEVLADVERQHSRYPPYWRGHTGWGPSDQSLRLGPDFSAARAAGAGGQRH